MDSEIVPIAASRLATQSAIAGGGVASLEGLPLMLTIAEEAAAVLRISRTTAYKLAEQWRSSGGQEGMPTVKLGSRLFVRRVDLAAMVGLGETG